MPDSAIVSALNALLPSLTATNKPIPHLLLSQSESLLSLSRQRASHLKPEEEIARPHACAEIACTRLRAQLRLPAIKNGAGAPCKPRVYAKLVKYLEGVLGDVSAVSSTPKGRKRDGAGNVKETVVSGGSEVRSAAGTSKRSQVGQDATPTKKRVTGVETGKEFVGTVKSRQKPRSNTTAENDERAPNFVMPSIRKMCKMLSTPTMVPHVYTGTCVVLELAKIWPPEEDVDDFSQTDVLSLVTALYLMVLTRMQTDQMTTEVYTEVLSKSAEVLKLDSDATDKVEEWISKLNEEGWCNGEEWWESVPESVLDFDLDADRVNDDNELADRQDVALDFNGDLQTKSAHAKKIGLNEQDPEGVLLPGLGTMLHEGIDWTSEDRCLDYGEWRANIIRRLAMPVSTAGKKQRLGSSR